MFIKKIKELSKPKELPTTCAKWSFSPFWCPLKKSSMKEFYEPDLIEGLDLNLFNGFAFFGVTKSGKGTLINNLLCKYFIHFIKPENIYVMSPTFGGDSTYDSFWMYLQNTLGKQYNSHVFKRLNTNKIEEIDNIQQKKLDRLK